MTLNKLLTITSLLGSVESRAEGLSNSEVTSVVRRNTKQISFCYESILGPNSPVEGKLLVRFKIMPTGSPKSVRVVEDHIGNAKLSECVVTKITRWTFPKPRDGKPIDVSFPFVFSASAPAK